MASTTRAYSSACGGVCGSPCPNRAWYVEMCTVFAFVPAYGWNRADEGCSELPVRTSGEPLANGGGGPVLVVWGAVPPVSGAGRVPSRRHRCGSSAEGGQPGKCVRCDLVAA